MEPHDQVESVSQCCICNHNLNDESDEIDTSIQCFLCQLWAHSTCTGLIKKNIPIVANLKFYHFICPSCIQVKRDAPKVSEIKDQIKSLNNSLVSSNNNSIAQLSDDVKQLKHEIQKLSGTLECTISKPPTFADILKQKKNASQHQPESSANKRDASSGTNTNNRHIIFIKGISKDSYKNPCHFRDCINEFAPRIKIKHIYQKMNDIICLFLTDQEDIDLFKANWQKSQFSYKASYITAHDQSTKQTEYSILLKHVPLNLTDSFIINELSKSHPSIKESNRFLKNGKSLYTVKITFSSLACMNKALSEGLILNNQFFWPEQYINIKKPTQCLKCYKFNHTATRCTAKENICSLCSGQHHYKTCTSEILKCVNCDGGHNALNKTCPIYKKMLTQVNQD